MPAEGVGGAWTSWLNPTSIFGGVLAVGTCALSAAVLLCADAERDRRAHPEVSAEVADWFARAALVSGVVVGALSLLAVAVLEDDAATLAGRLQGRAAVCIVISAGAGVTALVLLRRRRHTAARVPALLAVTAVLVGWGVAQYPWVLVDELRIEDRPAPDSTLVALLVALGAAAVLTLPPLVWLFRLTGRGSLSAGSRPDSSQALLDAAAAGDPPG